MLQNEVFFHSPSFGTVTKPCISRQPWKPNHQSLHPGHTKPCLKMMNEIGGFSFSFLVVVLSQTDLSFSGWLANQEQIINRGKDRDQHPKRCLFTAHTLMVTWRTPLGMLCSARWQHLQRQPLNSSRCQNQFTSSKWILKCSEKQLKKAGKGEKNKAAAHRQMAWELTGQLRGHCGTRRSSWTPDQRGDEIPLTAAAGRLVRCSQTCYGTHPAQESPMRGFSPCT